MTNSKRLLAATLVAALGLAACGGDDDDADTTTPTEGSTSGSEPSDSTEPDTTEPDTTTGSTEPMGSMPDGSDVTIGLAFDTGGRGDGTFNDSAARGTDQAEADFGVQVEELEAASAEDRQPNLETLAGAGANPIIGTGFAFSDPVAAVADTYPDTQFVIVDGFVAEAPANVTMLSYAAEQASFLVGAAAALKTESDHIGFIGGQEGALIGAFEAGFTAGAKHINPDIVVESQYLGAAGDDSAWNSPDEAKEIAAAWYADGADVIYTAAGGSGAGTIDAAVEADAWAIGVDSDQWAMATAEQQEHILTSALKRVDNSVYDVIEAALNGTLEGGFLSFDLENDGVGYSTSGGHIDDIVDQLDELKAQIIAKEIEVPTEP